MLTKEQYRAIFEQHCATLPADHADNVKRAMLATAAAQRDADAVAATAQGGRRSPVFVCGNCAQFIARIIKGDAE